MAEQQKITVPTPNHSGSFFDKESCHSHPSPTNSTFPFLKLPKEIQFQIYKWVVGNRTLHVWQNCHGRVYCYTCHRQSSQFDIYDSHAKPIIFEDKMSSTLPKEEPSFNLGHGCGCNFRERAQNTIDLSLLRVSRETAREAPRLFYSSNTWHLHTFQTFCAWRAVLPPEKLALIHHLHLVIPLNKDMSKPRSAAFRYKTVFSNQFIAQLPNVKVLHLELYLAHFVIGPTIASPVSETFSRQAHGKQVMELFQPLQRLKKLKDCTVVMAEVEFYYSDSASWYGPEGDRTQLFWKQKEALRVWAEDIKSLVLRRESLIV